MHMKRRNFITTVGGAIAGAGIAHTAHESDTGSSARAAMQTETESEAWIANSAESPSGMVEELFLTATGHVEYSGLSAALDSVTVRMRVVGPDGDEHTVAERQYDENMPDGTAGEYHYSSTDVRGGVLENTPYTQEMVSATEDGGTNETFFTTFVEGIVADANGNEASSEIESEIGIRISNTEGSVDTAISAAENAEIDMQNDSDAAQADTAILEGNGTNSS